MTDPRTITLENALKALGINPDNDPIHHARRWISGRDDDRRERDQALTERDNATARVSARELRIADLERDLTAKDDARSDAIRMAHAAAKISSDLAAAEITAALDDAGAPKVYNLEDDTERGIPDPERIRLLGERIHTLRAQVREAADATNYLDALIEAHNALDVLKAPRLADGCVLSLAARIRALYR